MGAKPIMSPTPNPPAYKDYMRVFILQERGLSYVA
jgi:hypothetical protein